MTRSKKSIGLKEREMDYSGVNSPEITTAVKKKSRSIESVKDFRKLSNNEENMEKVNRLSKVNKISKDVSKDDLNSFFTNSISQTEFNKYPTVKQLHSTMKKVDSPEEIKTGRSSKGNGFKTDCLDKLKSLTPREKCEMWTKEPEKTFHSCSQNSVGSVSKNDVQFVTPERKNSKKKSKSPFSPALISQAINQEYSSPMKHHEFSQKVSSWGSHAVGASSIPDTSEDRNIRCSSPSPNTPSVVDTYRRRNLSPVSEVSTEEDYNGRKLSQDCRRLKPPRGLSQREKLEWIQKNRIIGVWVQCCREECKKWRYLKETYDPMEVPEKWYCSMNKDARYNSCSKMMCPYYSGKELINVTYTAGSIVWAKMEGYPKWPAMIDDDPEFAHFYWLPASKSKTPVQYHVVFFDSKDVTRAWVHERLLEPFKKTDSAKSKDKNALKYLSRLKSAVDNARRALDMSLPERIEQYSFISRFKGKIYSYKHNIKEFVKKNNLPPYEDTSDSEEGEEECRKNSIQEDNEEYFDTEERSPSSSPILKTVPRKSPQKSRRRKARNSGEIAEGTHNRSLTESIHELSMEIDLLSKEALSVSPSPGFEKECEKIFSSPSSDWSDEEVKFNISQTTNSSPSINGHAGKCRKPRKKEVPKESVLPERDDKPKKMYMGKKGGLKKQQSFESLVSSLSSRKRSTSPSLNSQTGSENLVKNSKQPRSPRFEEKPKSRISKPSKATRKVNSAKQIFSSPDQTLSHSATRFSYSK